MVVSDLSSVIIKRKNTSDNYLILHCFTTVETCIKHNYRSRMHADLTLEVGSKLQIVIEILIDLGKIKAGTSINLQFQARFIINRVVFQI